MHNTECQIVSGGEVRNSSMELCRILSMFMIVMLHSTYFSFGYPTSLSNDCFLVLLFSSISIIGVNVFLLISGYFSIRIKLKSIVNLIFICLFACAVKLFIAYVFGSVDWKILFFISKSNWYIVSYIGLLIVSPILNSFIETVNRKDLGIIIIAFYIYSVYFSLFPRQSDIEPGFNNGCSVLWFMEVYMIGRYLKFYGFPEFLRRFSLFGYIVFVILFFCGQVVLLKLGYGGKYIGWFGSQNQPLVLFGALCFFYFFTKLSFQSKPINYIAKSTLTVLLIHSPSITKDYFIDVNNSKGIIEASCYWLVGSHCNIYSVYIN